MEKKIESGDSGYMLAFGPGFMAQSLLLEWK
jgi:predicted naringenin-chalcone synthase